VTDRELMQQALEALEVAYGVSLIEDIIPKDAPIKQAITALRTAIEQAEKQEPVAWKWHQAPVKTQWGDDMVVADIAIDKDHTVSVYCERDQAAKVEAMFIPLAAQRQWVGLTDAEIAEWDYDVRDVVMDIEKLLREKNT
jgi:hypothetical protein